MNPRKGLSFHAAISYMKLKPIPFYYMDKSPFMFLLRFTVTKWQKMDGSNFISYEYTSF